MPTTGLGFRYPSGTDYAGTGPDVPRAVGELAADLDAFLDNKYSLIGIVNIFNGTTSYTPNARATALYIEMVGAGGAGGGCTNAATNGAAGGGGGGGAHTAKFTTTIKTFTVAVGAGGTGVSGANGNPGGNTTFDSPSICTANGGGGGLQQTVAAGPIIGALGGTGGAPVTGDLLGTGAGGGCGMNLSATQVVGGDGGSSHWGGGAPGPKNSTVAGTNCSGYGGGGSGAIIISGGASQAGGNGGNGLIRVWEFSDA